MVMKIGCVWREDQGAIDQFEGGGGVAGLVGEDAEEMQGVGVAGIE